MTEKSTHEIVDTCLAEYDATTVTAPTKPGAPFPCGALDCSAGTPMLCLNDCPRNAGRRDPSADCGTLNVPSITPGKYHVRGLAVGNNFVMVGRKQTDPPGALDTPEGRKTLEQFIEAARRAHDTARASVDPRLPQSFPFVVLRKMWPGNFVDAWHRRKPGERLWEPWKWIGRTK